MITNEYKMINNKIKYTKHYKIEVMIIFNFNNFFNNNKIMI